MKLYVAVPTPWTLEEAQTPPIDGAKWEEKFPLDESWIDHDDIYWGTERLWSIEFATLAELLALKRFKIRPSNYPENDGDILVLDLIDRRW